MSDFEKFVEPSRPLQVSSLLRAYRFEVPANQRPYSWDKENWVDLWDDLQDVVRARKGSTRDSYDKFHFLGPMFFVPTDQDNVRRILDGQQRLATIAIAERVIFDLLDYKRAHGMITAEGAITLGRIHDAIIENQGGVEVPRIMMGKENSVFFSKVLTTRCTGGAIGDPNAKVSTLRAQRGSGKGNLETIGCYRFYLTNLLESIARANGLVLASKDQSSLRDVLSSSLNDPSEALLRNIHIALSEGFYVLANLVPDIGIMYEIFETLNQRGEKLLVSDLFKNFIFELYENELGERRMGELWDDLSTLAGDDLDDFLRHFWLSNFEFVRKKKLFRAIKKQIGEKSADEFEEFMQTMTGEARIYFALRDPSSSDWTNRDGISHLISELEYLGYRQGLPLLLATYTRHATSNLQGFESLLKAYRNLCVRAYTILGGNPNEFEEEFSTWARDVRAGRLDLADAVGKIKQRTPSDDNELKKAFVAMKGKKATVVKYIFAMINDSMETTPLHRVWGKQLTLEHVIPQSTDSEWDNYLVARRVKKSDVLDRIGNLTILSGSENQELGNLPYATKRARYLAMQLPINEATFTGGPYDEFDVDAIRKREETIGDLAVSHNVWSSH